MKPLICVSATLLLGVTATGPAHADFKRKLAAEIESSYIFRGLQRAEIAGLYSAELELGDFYIKGLRVEPLGADEEEFNVETRFTGGWRPTFGSKRFTWDFGGQTFRLANDVTDDVDHRFEAFAGVEMYAPLNPAVHVYYDTEDEIFTTEAGLFHYQALPLSLSLQSSFDAGLVTPLDNDFEDYAYFQGRADIVRSFLFGIEAYAGVRGVLNTEDEFLEDNPEIWFGGGASWTF